MLYVGQISALEIKFWTENEKFLTMLAALTCIS